VLALVVLALQACSSPYGSAAGASPPDPSEAGTDGASDGPDVVDAEPPEPPDDDAGVVISPVGGDGGINEPCPVLPVTAKSATPPGATGIVCTPNGALVASDGVVAGLDSAAGGTIASVGGTTVSSCVALDFGAGVLLNDATARLASIGSACGVACAPGTGCGTYDRAALFFAAQPGTSAWTFAGTAPITPALTDYRITIPTGANARYIVVCRTGGGAARDDVVVDAVTGHCR
jgi:hypothetical protein